MVADALSRLNLTNKEFSPEAFAFVHNEFPKNYPLTYAQLEHEQERYPALQENHYSRKARVAICSFEEYVNFISFCVLVFKCTWMHS